MLVDFFVRRAALNVISWAAMASRLLEQLQVGRQILVAHAGDVYFRYVHLRLDCHGRLEGVALRRLEPRRVKVVALEDFLRRRKPMRMALVLRNLVKHLEGRGDEAGKAQTGRFAHLGGRAAVRVAHRHPRNRGLPTRLP